MSQATRGSEMDSQSSVGSVGVCDHVPRRLPPLLDDEDEDDEDDEGVEDLFLRRRGVVMRLRLRGVVVDDVVDMMSSGGALPARTEALVTAILLVCLGFVYFACYSCK